VQDIVYYIIITDNTYTNTIKYLIKYVESQFITYVTQYQLTISTVTVPRTFCPVALA